MNIIDILLSFFSFFVWCVIAYILMLTVNNFIWGYKGVTVEKGSSEYKRRKKLFRMIAIPVGISLALLWSLWLAPHL